LCRETGNGSAVDNGLAGCGVNDAWENCSPMAPARIG